MNLDSLIKGFGLTQNILTIILLLIILFYVLTINKNLSLMELFSLGGQQTDKESRSRAFKKLNEKKRAFKNLKHPYVSCPLEDGRYLISCKDKEDVPITDEAKNAFKTLNVKTIACSSGNYQIACMPSKL